MKKTIAWILALMLIAAFAASAEGVSITTGLPTDHEARTMACQMDNEPGARPQKGIGSADVVYEVEIYDGGYTRYTAVFNDTIPEKIEAIRSARIVHAWISHEYRGAFIHYGGQKYPNTDFYHVLRHTDDFAEDYDGIKGDGDFYRDKGRKAPNNVVCKLKNLYDRTDWSAAQCRSPLAFSEAFRVPDQGEAVSNLRIVYREKSYVPSYEWDASVNKYRRLYNGKPFVDGDTGEQLLVDNVIVQHVDYSWYDGASDRPVVTLKGENKCDYFIGGKHFTGTWKRANMGENTVYYDDNGEVVKLNPGKTFIQILRMERDVEIQG